MKNITLILISLMFLIGCAPNVKPTHYESVVLNIPEVAAVNNKELGDTLVSKTNKTEVDSIDVYESVSPSLTTSTLTTLPGTYTAMWEGDEGVYYGGRNAIENSIGARFLSGGFVIPFGNRNSQKDVIVWVGDSGIRPIMNVYTNEDIKFTRGKVIFKDRPFFKQELIYNGRSGNNIKFLYREFRDDYMRAVFTQDIQYDLSESRTVGFKGVRLDIIKATNSQIEYIVRKPFP